jgi:hemerythrin-like metal-binding protein
MSLMTQVVREQDDGRWMRSAGTYRQTIIRLAEEIHSLKNRGSSFEAEQVEHEAIDLVLQSLWDAVVSDASRAEVIEILDTLVDFSATHFADEEEFMRKRGYAVASAHVSAHKQLLAAIVAARRCASGEGLSLAVLDVADLLNDFHQHVKTWDGAASAAKPRPARKRAAMTSPPLALSAPALSASGTSVSRMRRASSSNIASNTSRPAYAALQTPSVSAGTDGCPTLTLAATGPN